MDKNIVSHATLDREFVNCCAQQIKNWFPGGVEGPAISKIEAEALAETILDAISSKLILQWKT